MAAFLIPLIGATLTAYAVGGIPFGLLITRLAGHGDIRKVGSGNIGATNVLRAAGKPLAALTLLLDFGKGYAALWLCGWWLGLVGPALPVGVSVGEMMNFYVWQSHVFSAAAIGVIVGHCFPIWLKFRGGKGIATLFGVAFAIHYSVGLICAAFWIGIFATSRFSSLAGMVMAAGFGIALYSYQSLMWAAALVIPVLVIARHHENIRRLMRQEEHRFEWKKPS